ncbi:ABC transporter substrate-binding protein [Frankia sp. R43]|uniref:ABC transporter substrate-binding protein n=1 Tax=Frankia sp. R43 TaxID=269536 RepID=UPI0006CA52AC|nr:ABC transporter substrate-binding protein [Frankia sp. R43]KPM51905.1 ABC transporter substrate-binding protein [Frankia sp. R43]
MARPRLSLAAAGIALVALTAGACATSSSPAASTTDAAGSTSTIPELSADQKVSIVFESYNLTSTGTWKPAIEGLLAEFQKEHPNITVKAQPPQGASQTDIVGSIKNQALAGNPPDVAQVTFNALSFAATSLGAQPIDTLVGKDAVQANFEGDHPFAESARTLGDVNGHTYAVPYVFSTPVLWYNASLFRQAGLDPEKPPTTWAEVKTAATAIKEKTGKGGVLIDCLTKSSGDWCFQSLVLSNGGRVLSEDGTKLTFAESGAVGAVQMAADLVKAGVSPNLSQAQAFETFGRGDLGMLLETSAVQGLFIQQSQAGGWELRAAAEPGFGSKAAVPTNSGSGLTILSTDPAKQRASWELIKFLTSDRAYTVISSKIGYLPLRPSLVDDPATLKDWADKNPLIKPNLAQLTRLKPWVSFPGDDYQQIGDLMMTAVESAVYGGKDAKSTLAEAQRQANDLLPTK